MLLHYATLQVLLDRLDKLNHQAVDLDVNLLDKKIDQMMPELGFMPQDNDRLVASYSGGWQMRMCLGKLLLQVTYHCRACRLGDVLSTYSTLCNKLACWHSKHHSALGP